ncbi:ubiquinone biosynthesis accessory factor UbiJ [Crenothrix polyspora]|uniref:Ubiquinone biosynthesis accessory factor UbiJ n=1 Tax=Crenothrix polyspora TaxID=360316 RepID=A0A1R4HGU5_9GAMM|nr:SCP2 sterol-binding domain-containing protein [Crenothrix polyspora]SJM95437.1 Sterol-binding domain protein [Crenothrix polyspora]
MAIKPLLFSVLETALNHYLALGDNRDAVLTPLAGKVIAITVQPFNETAYLCCSADAIQLLDQVTEPADTTLTGSLWAFGLMGLSKNPMRTVFSGQVKIEGDMHAGRRFQELFAKLDINLEAHLARVAGDKIAHDIAHMVHVSQSWSTETLETLRLNTAEFLQEETRDLPPGAELDIFFRHIDALRTSTDRLHSRLARLEAFLSLPPTTAP